MAFRKQNTRTIEPAKALLKLEELCSRSEHCEYELRLKLSRWNISAPDAETIINSLKHRRFVDNERFARAYVRDKFRFSRWGRRKISIGLTAKRIDHQTVRAAMEEINDEEYEANLIDIMKSKARNMEDSGTYEGRTRLFRFAASRGYEPDLVASVIRRLFI